MRIFSDELKQHLSQSVTTACSCWIVRRRDGVVLGFTDHDRNLVIDGIECSAASGFQPTQAMQELGLSVDDQEIEGAIQNTAISEDDLSSGKYDDARVEIWLVNWLLPVQRHHLRTAILGELKREDGVFKAELRGMSSLLDQVKGRTYSRPCDAQLGDARCGVSLLADGMKIDGSVEQVFDRRRISCTALGEFESGWFEKGQLTWNTGKNSGQDIEIISVTGGINCIVELWSAMPLGIQVGDEFSITAGCDKNFLTCNKKFGNGANFRGFPHLPGADFALGYAGRDSVHDGSPLIDYR